MEDVLLLENPRRRRRTPSRGRGGRFKRRSSTKRRRRRRNPLKLLAANPRRRRRVKRRRRRNPAILTASNPRRRSRKRRRSASRGGKMLSVRRAMGVVTDGATLVLAEFAGDALSKAIAQKTGAGEWMVNQFGISQFQSEKWIQLTLACIAGPMLRQIKIVPRQVLRYWELGNAAAALIGLTYEWRLQAMEAMGLEGIGYPGGAAATGISDWVTSTPSAAPQPGPPPADALSDWATVDGSASYTGDPFTS